MELTYLDDVLAHQGSLICLLLAVPAAVTDAIMRSLCGRTVPDGAVGILLAGVFARMPLMWTSVGLISS